MKVGLRDSFVGEEYCLEQVGNIVLEYRNLLFKGGQASPFIFSCAPFNLIQFNFNSLCNLYGHGVLHIVTY